MNKEYTARTELLLGSDGVRTLENSAVLVFGLGGVGSFTVEALVRVGVGRLILVDGDAYDTSNVNRQLGALADTVGQKKTDVMAERVRAINPDICIETHCRFYLPGTGDDFIAACRPDYIVDVVDTAAAKVGIIEEACRAGIPVISSMGAGNKLHPELFTLDYIENTSVDPLARIVRKELRRKGIGRIKVVYSTEKPVVPEKTEGAGHPLPGSVSFVPSVAGMLMAGAVVRDILHID